MNPLLVIFIKNSQYQRQGDFFEAAVEGSFLPLKCSLPFICQICTFKATPSVQASSIVLPSHSPPFLSSWLSQTFAKSSLVILSSLIFLTILAFFGLLPSSLHTSNSSGLHDYTTSWRTSPHGLMDLFAG